MKGCDKMSSQYTQKEKQDALNLALRDGGFYSEDGTWNSIISFPGDDRIYRGRVETLIVKDFSSVFMKLHDDKYRIPGGSFEKNIPNMEQAVNECREEARINVKNIQSTGISYKEATKTPKWAKDKNIITWNGKYTEVYIAEYESKYTGKIDPEDVDNDMATGTFVPIKAALKILSDYHKQALTQWLATHKDEVTEVYKKEQNATLYSAANKEFTEFTDSIMNGIAMTESMIRGTDDIYYNKDKFDSGEINLCFITGHSGSGKSTMGKKMSGSKIEWFDLDDVIANWNFSDNNLKEYGDMIYSFFKGPGKKFRYTSHEEWKNDTKWDNTDEYTNGYEVSLITAFVDYAKKFAKSHKNIKFVLEGVWIFHFIEPKDIDQYAVYIKGTSLLISKYRAAKRDSHNDAKGIKQIRQFARYVTHGWKNYFMDENKIQKYKTYFSSKMVTESAKNISAKDIYFLSDKNFDKQTLYPRVPNNFFTRKGYEDPSTPRICFCSSISGCLIAMARNLENSELYVHKAVGNPPIHVCTPKEVPDTVITHEIWTTGPTQMKCIGKIKVGRAKDKKLTFRYGDVNTGELSNWNWEWLERYTKQTVTERAKTLTRKQLLEKAWNIIDETGGRAWRKHDGKLVNIKGFLSGETDGTLIGSAGKIGTKEMCRLLKNEIPEANFIEDNYNTLSISVPKGSYISEATYHPSLGYKPLYTNKFDTKQMVDEFARNRSSDLNSDIATMVFESMSFFNIPKDYIKSKNPLYDYIDLWEDANQNLHTIVTERAVTDQDVTYLIQYFDNTIVILGKLLYTLQDILYIAKNVRTEILIKELNIKSKHRTLVARYLNDIRFNMNKVIFIIKCMKATGYNINQYYDVKLREYNQQMIEYQKAMKKLMKTYDFIRIRLDSEGTTLSKTAAFNLSLLMDSIKGTLNEIQVMLIELS